MSEERGEKLAGEQGTVRGTAYQQEMQRRLARLNLGSGAFTDVMRDATTECRLFEGERAQLLESERGRRTPGPRRHSEKPGLPWRISATRSSPWTGSGVSFT